MIESCALCHQEPLSIFAVIENHTHFLKSHILPLLLLPLYLSLSLSLSLLLSLSLSLQHIPFLNIQEGDGIPDLSTTAHVLEVLKQVGFEILDARDLVDDGEVPWYQPLVGGWSLENIRSSKLGRVFTTVMVNILETVRLAPKGTVKTHDFLIKVG